MSIAAQKTPYYFISYSRQEVTFADSFAREIEKRGLSTWVDFRNLIPGRPWQDQLDDGVNHAEAILLVVSKASMSSLPVRDELTKSLAKGKRIILVSFEPCKLDPELKGLEWVDFTRGFDKAMDKLVNVLASPPQPAASVPLQNGVRLSGPVLTFMLLSLILVLLCASISIISVVLFGTILFTTQGLDQLQIYLISSVIFSGSFIWLPAIVNFTWLPIQIIRRTHNAQRIRNTLNALFYSSLLFITLSGILYFRENTPGSFLSFLIAYLVAICLIIIALCLYLNYLLVSKTMYRWSGANGVLIRSTPPDLTGHIGSGAKMQVAIEYAPEDRLYAEELKTRIKQAGHTCTDQVLNANCLLVLLSAYKNNSRFSPEIVPLIPVLIQNCNVDKSLSQVQWIDLRYGKVSMDAVAHLLDRPAELSRVLGVLPVRTAMLPNVVKWLAILLSFLLTVSLILALAYIAIMALDDTLDEVYFNDLIQWVALIPGLYFLRRYIINRKLGNLPFISYWWVVGYATLLAVAGSTLGFGWATLLLPLMMLHKDVRLWLPLSGKSLHP